MPLFKSKQFSSVIEWADPEEGVLFHRFDNIELKKGSVCILRPGQDVIIVSNGEVNGVFTKDGRYNVESDIIPFLSTAAGIKFGFDSGRRIEAVFVNTKDILQNWGTRSPINIEFPGLPGGIPVRANGNFVCRVDEEKYPVLVENIAGIQTDTDDAVSSMHEGSVANRYTSPWLKMSYSVRATNTTVLAW